MDGILAVATALAAALFVFTVMMGFRGLVATLARDADHEHCTCCSRMLLLPLPTNRVRCWRCRHESWAAVLADGHLLRARH